MPTFINAEGQRTEAVLSTNIYKAAIDKGVSVPQYINRTYPTEAGAEASTFEQMCASAGLFVGGNKEFGLRSPTLDDILSGRAEINAAAVADANPASRILYPAVILELIESGIAVDRETDPMAFDKMVAADINVTSNRVEQPVVNVTGAEVRAKVISQLAPPQTMLSITTSDTARSLPTMSIGMEVSDQALSSTTLDFVSMVVERQLAVERNARTYDYLLGCLNGDEDMGQSALAVTKANVYDTSITGAGAVTKKALVKWLVNNYYKRHITHIVTDIDGMLAMETALQTTNTNQPVPGALTPQFSLMNRLLESVQLFIVDSSAGWTANTLMGLDARSAIIRIRNSAAAYSAVEQFVLRRSSALRFDFSEIAYRFRDEAFDTLSLTL